MSQKQAARDAQRKMRMFRRPSMTTIEVLPSPKEEYKFISQDLPRKLIVPKVPPKIVKGIINEEKFENLKKAAATRLSEEEEAVKINREKLNEQLKKEQEKRRLEFEAYDLIRKKNEKLSELDEEAKQKMEYLRAKANQSVKEQNEEIKEINKLILSAKVQAIRDSQVEEKKLIKKEHAIAEGSLDCLMENERIKGIIKERELKEKRKAAAYKNAEKLQEQIKINSDVKLLQGERKIKEGELLVKKMLQNHQRDHYDLKMQKFKKESFRQELIRENEEIAKRKQEMKIQSKREDFIISEYQKLKIAQEDAKVAAEKEAKLKREKEIAKLGELHERASDLQAEQDALRARRAQEEKERQYRLKEKQEALKRKEMVENLVKCRDEQLEHQEKLRLAKAKAEYEELDILLKKIDQETRAEKRKELVKKLENLKHLEELKSQMRKREMEKINERRAFYNEGIHLQQETKRQNEMLELLKKEKLNELKKLNVKDTYINHIKRKTNVEE